MIPISNRLHNLLQRKIEARRRELDESVISRRVEIHEALTRRIQKYIPASSQRPGRTSIFSASFREMTDLAVEISKKWPNMVWQTVLETLESTGISPTCDDQLKILLEQFTWKDPSGAFTLELCDAEGMQATMDLILSRYGLPKCHTEDLFEKTRDFEASLAKVAVIHAARTGKSRVKLALEEYLIKESVLKQSKPARHGKQPPRDDLMRCSLDDCFPNLPKNRDKLWVGVICEAISDFIAEFGKCPNQNELWSRLCKKPPKSYLIEKKRDSGGEEAIWSADQSLGKTAFQQRFRQYKQPKTQQ